MIPYAFEYVLHEKRRVILLLARQDSGGLIADYSVQEIE